MLNFVICLSNGHPQNFHSASRLRICNNIIFYQATTTIKKLHETNKQLMNEKSSLLLDKKSKASNVFKLISQLPPKQRYEESKKLMAVMNSSEPIEIVDSDEEKEGRSVRKEI